MDNSPLYSSLFLRFQISSFCFYLDPNCISIERRERKERRKALKKVSETQVIREKRSIEHKKGYL